MVDIAQISMDTASKFAERKELAIKGVIDYFFPDGWTEEGIAERLSSEVYPNFREVLFVDGVPVLEFGELQFNHDVDIDAGKITCQYSQTIKVLY